GDPDQPLTPTFIGDFGRTLAVVGAADTSSASVWHVPHPGVTTGRQLVIEACRQAGARLRMHRHGSAQIRLAGRVWPLAREGADLIYQFEQPFVVDGSRCLDAFGVQPTPYAEGIRSTLAASRGAVAVSPSVSPLNGTGVSR
ncbi:MAG: hypothetical protein ABWX96_14185, partial [Propionibacteriaceae bacterium]